MSANVRHSSETNEHYSPIDVVEAARLAIGAIDLDPASCELANRTVRASAIHTAETDGFTKAWGGRVFLNPPGGQSDNLQRPVKAKCRETGACGLPPGHTHEGVESSQKKWWFKLAREWAEGRVEAAIFVCFSLEMLQTTQVDTPTREDRSLSGARFTYPLPLPLDFPIAVPSRRLAYSKVTEDGAIVKGGSPPHASAIVFLSADHSDVAFVQAFKSMGRVTIPVVRARRAARSEAA